MRIHKSWLLSLAGVAAVLSSCSPAPTLRVEEAVIKLSPVDSNPSALYFVVYGGTKDVKLLSVASPSVIRMEMHESKMDPKTGAMTMAPIQKLNVPAGSKIPFARGGKHVMVWGVNLKARRLGEMQTEYLFSDGSRIAVDAVVEEMDGTKPDEQKAIS